MTFEKVRDIICDELNVDAAKVTMDTKLADDLGADSLDATQIIIAIEDEFGIEIADEKAQTIRTVRDIVDYVSSVK